MQTLLIAAVALLSFANGANDNFKGVATLWGAGRTSYWRALVWATASTLLGSLTAAWAASGLAAKFSGAQLVGREIYTQPAFLLAVTLAGAATVLLASRLGLPISTTHALTGALVGAGITAAGLADVNLRALTSGVIVPLLFSPLVALGLTLALYPLVKRFAGARDCVCVDEPIGVRIAPAGSGTAALMASTPLIRWAPTAECNTGAEAVRWSIPDALHWLPGAGISFARGLNDTPKIAAVLLVASAAATKLNYALVALAMAMGGMLGAARVARTMSKQITPMAADQAVTANLVAATLVTLASCFALPVSTTHVISGSIVGVGVLRRTEADWRRVRDILLSWLLTLPLGAALAFLAYRILVR